MSLSIPKPDLGEASVKVSQAGACNTDLEILQGYMGFTGVFGHEFVGRVLDVNTADDSLKQEWVGSCVCRDMNVGCAKDNCAQRLHECPQFGCKMSQNVSESLP